MLQNLMNTIRILIAYDVGLVIPLILALVVMLLLQKMPGLVIRVAIVVCIVTMLADTLMSFVKAGKIGSMAVGEYSSDIPEGTP